ncbi:chromosome partition protein MukE [Oceanimonas baumannii]|uniref:Chromosome partitioning protein MukE n=1 Tax=Oceanimonas baumannii TaxID=129578 RepID=A0A235CAA6_9GAMM|nr:chromosome partition protein MukE [Oceanimonas baumannii]OYD21374.1 chromosome partitioning protein MukE [Oceanimonas baumannii]TDW56407.1 condensin subunit MukE [Oceanimonas baumannii]
MLSTNTEQALDPRLVQAIANPLFPALDNQLRSGRHITADELEQHSLLQEYYPELDAFYQRYQAELVRAPEGFYYLRPRSTSELGTSILSELEMLVGKVLCYLYLSPDRLINEGVFSVEDLQEEILTLSNEQALLRMVNQRAGGSDLDKRKLADKLKSAIRRLKRIGMVSSVGSQDKFRITEAVFRFAADVRSDEDPRELQLRMIKEGEAVAGAEQQDEQENEQ